MNYKRRKRIHNVIERLSGCKSDLESIKEEEDETRDNIPESLQKSNMYCDSEECRDKIEDVISDLGDVIESLENI